MGTIYGFEEPEVKPQLHHTKYLTTGIVLSVIAVVLALVQIIFYLIDSISTPSDDYTIYTVLSVISALFFVGILLVFMSYISNFKMQSLKMIGIMVIILFFISMMMDIAYPVLQKRMFDNGGMNISQWSAITGIVYMLFNLIFWAASIAFSAVMISNKTDFVGGIRTLGTIYLVMILINIVIYFIRIFALPYLSIGYESTMESMRLANALLSAVTLGVRIILFSTFIYVFAKAKQYKTING